MVAQTVVIQPISLTQKLYKSTDYLDTDEREEERRKKEIIFSDWIIMTMKALLPTLRERKRYVGFEILTDGNLEVGKYLQDSFFSTFTQLFGEVGLANAGVLFVKSKKSLKNKGILRVQHTYVDHIKATFACMKNGGIVKSVTTSGMIAHVEDQLIKLAN